MPDGLPRSEVDGAKMRTGSDWAAVSDPHQTGGPTSTSGTDV